MKPYFTPQSRALGDKVGTDTCTLLTNFPNEKRTHGAAIFKPGVDSQPATERLHLNNKYNYLLLFSPESVARIF